MTDVQENKIRITKDMSDAGVRALFQHDPYFYAEDDIVAKIYEAMEMARVCAHPTRE